MAAKTVFSTLDKVESRLAREHYLCGDRLTEADCRLLPTLVRFDVGYYSAFKCNLRRISDHTYLPDYMDRLLAIPELQDTVNFDIYWRGYHSESRDRNPHGVVPVGPMVGSNRMASA